MARIVLLGMPAMTDPVETLARSYASEAWDRIAEPQRVIWRNEARAILALIAPALVAEAVAEAVAQEREACAKLADNLGWPGSMSGEEYDHLSHAQEAEYDRGTLIAHRIRNRSTK